MIEAAINKTNDEKKELTMAQLGEVIKIARDLGKMPKGTTRKYNSISFDMWAKQAADDTKVEIIEDKNDTVAAFLSIADRHADLKGKQELVELEAPLLVKIFDQADTPINHLQQATAALAYLNSERETAQIWVVPAG
jgi:translation elongation factor EF-4